MELEVESKKKEKTFKIPKINPKKILLLSAGLFVFSFVAGAGLLALKLKEEKKEIVKEKEVRKEVKMVKREVKKPNPPAPLPERKKFREVEKVKIDRNPFVDFYEKRYIAELRESIKKELVKKIKEEVRIDRDRVLKELKEKLKPAVEVDFKVEALICDRTCYVITDRGVFRDGDFYKGRRLKISERGVELR